MTSNFETNVIVTALLLTIAVHSTNGMPAPVVTSSPLAQSDLILYRDMAMRTKVLSQMTQQLATNFSNYFYPISDAGPCFQNSSIGEMKRALETMCRCNDTLIQSTTAHVLAKTEKILEVLIGKPDIYSGQVHLFGNLKTETSSAYVELTGNQTLPEVTLGMICQGSETLTELLSILNAIKDLFDSMNTIFSRAYQINE